MDDNGKDLNTEQQWREKESPKEQTCLICGCTDSKACEGGCSWAIPGICSKCITDRVPECIDLLIAVILETHQAEILAGHHRDRGCSTCDLIEFARKIEKALRQ